MLNAISHTPSFAAAFSLTLVAVCFSLGGPQAVAGGRSSKADAAEELVREALRAEVSGDNERRGRLVERALSQAPGCSSAHWQAGHVRAGNKWLTLSQAERYAGQDPRLQEYGRLRAAWADEFVGFDEQLALARWCQNQQLVAQARYHWYRVLQTQPQHAEALQGLDAVWYGGSLMARQELDRLQRDARRATIALNTWGRRIARWAERLERRDRSPEQAGEALRSLREVDDPEAIAALEKVMATSDRAFALEAVGLFGEMPAHESTQALVRVAVLSPTAEVRAAATEQLVRRPLHDYVPLLMSGLEQPLESWFHISLSPAGHVTYRHELYREGAAADTVFHSTRSFVQFDIPGGSVLVKSYLYGDAVLPSTPGQEAHKRRVKQHQAGAAAGRFAAMVDEMEQQVTQANERSDRINQRIQDVLARVTGQQVGPAPEAWWDWWRDYNEVYFDGEKPVYERYLTGYTETTLVPEVWMSCFPRGTLVRTQTGPNPIEQIRAGDLVLAQDVATGELAYKPVLKTTVRPPCRILRLEIDGETIAVTRGHPFWVSGVGWRMAKRLEDGQLIHGVSGSQPVRRVEEGPEQAAYNLVVGDFSTYFVGETGILVHDNTYRRPTTALVPGLPR